MYFIPVMKAEFSVVIIPVLSVTWSFRNNFNLQIRWSKNNYLL